MHYGCCSEAFDGAQTERETRYYSYNSLLRSGAVVAEEVLRYMLDQNVVGGATTSTTNNPSSTTAVLTNSLSVLAVFPITENEIVHSAVHYIVSVDLCVRNKV